MADVINVFLTVCMSVIVVLMLLCLYRAVRGPRFTDRIVMGNAISTMVIVLIVLIAIKCPPPPGWAFLVAQLVKNPPALQETWV